MNFKKLLALLLSLCLLLNFAACGKDKTSDSTTKGTTTKTIAEESDTVGESETNENTEGTTAPEDSGGNNAGGGASVEDGITPLLYKVTDANGNVLWLFGSIHVGKEYFYPLPDYVLNAYNSSDALAVEFDVTEVSDDALTTSMMMDMAYMDGSKIGDHIDKELYEEAKEILRESGYYFSSMDIFKPVMWSMLIDELITEQLNYDADLGIDMFFLNTAHEENKKIYDIESMEFQMDMLTGYSEELQIMMLESSVYYFDNIDEYQKDLDDLANEWAVGNAEALAEEDDYEFESAEEEALYREYNTAMMTKRNRGMTNFAENALKSGEEVFIVVGAAHMVGDDGIANQLKERGYTVEEIRG